MPGRILEIPMHLLSLTLFALVVLVAPARAQEKSTPTPPSQPSIAPPPALDRVLRDYERAWKAGDAAALAALFTEDGFVPTGQGWVRGRDAIRATYAHAGGGLQLRALAFAVQDSVGYIVGAYGYGDAPPVPDRGKFVLALRRKAGGAWLIAADIDNSNRP
jgi:ketosteroid isomerase-like protein